MEFNRNDLEFTLAFARSMADTRLRIRCRTHGANRIRLGRHRFAARRDRTFCRYAPEGHRSWGPVRAALRPASAPPQRVYLMIEDTYGLAEADDICATPGLDGILIGTADLTLSLAGSASDVLGGATFDAVRAIVEACTRHGLDVAAYGGSQEMTTSCAENGIRTVALAADYEVLHEGAQAALAQARASYAAQGARL
ncbi:aldolase/citrate lyase family protein [Rhodococcus oxybenzonivorans]|uniref:aldolase/citrate lyase family protein n=1 Tax=Rhodococcus oxybenzonivorans TaxID=1990687 RepID=UPI002954532C|nr:aldolase/citrate lyase family protein [Rhodococcus oxybenzonivorans]MDV7353295.1 aldolase/citrate lyase family protein [Rhodococcus oxybenzonivorans]